MLYMLIYIWNYIWKITYHFFFVCPYGNKIPKILILGFSKIHCNGPLQCISGEHDYWRVYFYFISSTEFLETPYVYLSIHLCTPIFILPFNTWQAPWSHHGTPASVPFHRKNRWIKGLIVQYVNQVFFYFVPILLSKSVRVSTSHFFISTARSWLVTMVWWIFCTLF